MSTTQRREHIELIDIIHFHKPCSSQFTELSITAVLISSSGIPNKHLLSAEPGRDTTLGLGSFLLYLAVRFINLLRCVFAVLIELALSICEFSTRFVDLLKFESAVFFDAITAFIRSEGK
jgi:hypothetical protein